MLPEGFGGAASECLPECRQLSPRSPEALGPVGPNIRPCAHFVPVAFCQGASPLLGRILAMLQANNPIQTVLEDARDCDFGAADFWVNI